jgi:hypothetical protein
MSDLVNVIAEFNPVSQVKPIWLSYQGKKSKITKIYDSKDVRGILVFNCVCDGRDIVLLFDVMNLKWSIDIPIDYSVFN